MTEEKFSLRVREGIVLIGSMDTAVRVVPGSRGP